MTAIFHDLMGDIVEDDVDDILVKSKTASQHIQHLEKIAERLLQYQLRLNPQKCVFGVSSGKLLGFIVRGSSRSRYAPSSTCRHRAISRSYEAYSDNYCPLFISHQV